MARVFVLVIFGLTLSATFSQEECPNGWTALYQSCYFFAVEMKTTWIDAAHYCLVHKGHLVKVDSADEDAFIRDNVSRFFTANGISKICGVCETSSCVKPSTQTLAPGREDSFWLGATDDIIEDVWVWSVDDSALEYTNWNVDQPDSNGGTSNQDCLAILGDEQYKWHDIECNEEFHPICEINLYEEIGDVVG